MQVASIKRMTEDPAAPRHDRWSQTVPRTWLQGCSSDSGFYWKWPHVMKGAQASLLAQLNLNSFECQVLDPGNKHVDT